VKHHHWAVTAFIAVTLAVLMWAGYHWHEPWEHNADWALLSPAHTVGTHHHIWVWFWKAVSDLLYVMRFTTTVAIGAALAWKRWGTAVLLIACGPLSYLVSSWLKSWVNRPRPITHLDTVPGTSFPSGHAFETTAGVLALVVLIAAVYSHRRRLLLGLGLGVIVLVGCARVALNVHNPSDVVAGWAMGFVYFAALYLVLRLFDRPIEVDYA
jgi:membrane-associated phospholipid phosphatase